MYSEGYHGDVMQIMAEPKASEPDALHKYPSPWTARGSRASNVKANHPPAHRNIPTPEQFHAPKASEPDALHKYPSPWTARGPRASNVKARRPSAHRNIPTPG